ncbi:MAG: hypothetical protein V4631_20810 [Pseudomonadota bacterium]
MEPYLLALLVHGVIGGADVVLNHELIAKIPSRPNAGPEQWLHSARELVFGIIFLALAWYQWHGVAALAIGALLLAELVISTVDTVIEVDTRVLPVSERILHVFLFVNMGVVVTLVGQALLAWTRLPTGLVAAGHGAPAWVLSVLALVALGWSVRDGLNALQRRAVSPCA